MQVLEDRDDRLHAALAQQQTRHCLIRGLPMLEWLEGSEWMRGIQHIEEIQHRRNRVLQRGIERQNPVCHFLTDQSRAVLDVDLEIIPEQFDNRQVGRCAAVGNRIGFQDQPVSRMVRMNELVDQARLAHAGFSDHRRHLASTLIGKLLRVEELIQLGVAADEARQAPSRGGLEASARGTNARHLVDLHQISDAFHRHGPAEGTHRDVAFRQPECVGCCQHGTGLRHLLHARRQVGCLAHDGVVHVQVVADGTDDDLT